MQTSHQTVEISTNILIAISSIILWIAIIFIIHKCTKRSNKSTPSELENHEHHTPERNLTTPIKTPQTPVIISPVSATTQYQYSVRHQIMTNYEQKIFLILNDLLTQKCYVIPQVHLSKLLNHKIKGQNWQGAFSHINSKSVDFVLLRKSTLEPLCAIELDDWTHKLQERQERDREVERILRQAGLPLIRFENIDKLSKQEIIDHIAQGIKFL